MSPAAGIALEASDKVVEAEIGPPYFGETATVGADNAVVAVLTVSAPLFELPVKLASPEYVAVVEYVLTPSTTLELGEQCPVPAAKVIVHSVVAPCVTATVPPGVPEPGEVAATLAVKTAVVSAPKPTELGATVKLVTKDADLVIEIDPLPVEPLKFDEPA